MAYLNAEELYVKLKRHLLPKTLLGAHEYPKRDPNVPSLREAPSAATVDFASRYTCKRCKESYEVNKAGVPLMSDLCVNHPGHWWSIEGVYSCCKLSKFSKGCQSSVYHVNEGESLYQTYMGYVSTPQRDEWNPNKHGVYALDCETSFTTHGLELTRVTVIDHKHEVVYKELVKPANIVLDYNTKYTGIWPGDLDNVSTTLADVQRALLEIFSSETILVGHDLSHEMKALKMFHENFVDTVNLYPHRRGLPFKKGIKTLVADYLGDKNFEKIPGQNNGDASMALRLALRKISNYPMGA